jgi:hypothetical protein
LVFLSNQILDLHIRTKNNSGWAGIEAAAIMVGSNKLVVQEPYGSIFVNNVNVTSSPPSLIGEYPFAVLAGPPLRFRLNFTGEQYIEITRTHRNTLQVDVLGHGSDFGNSNGLCGNWPANSPVALIGRDGLTVFQLSRPNPFGEHWQVNKNLGDQLLFQSNSLSRCRYSGGGTCNKTGTQNCSAAMNKAKIACKNVTTSYNARRNCEFDVQTTGDIDFAQTVAYTNPLTDDPIEFCFEISANVSRVNATTCTGLGGKCVWRCDDRFNQCLNRLCTGPTFGCSCALPLATPDPYGTPRTSTSSDDLGTVGIIAIVVLVLALCGAFSQRERVVVYYNSWW